MGNWNITIRGTGAHHNEDYPKDANRMAAEFVKALEAAGHIVHQASITYGAEDSLQHREAYPPTKQAIEYLEERDKIEHDLRQRRQPPGAL